MLRRTCPSVDVPGRLRGLAALQGGQATQSCTILKAQTPEPRPHSQKTALPDSRSHLIALLIIVTLIDKCFHLGM